MSASTRAPDDRRSGPFGWLRNLVALLVIAAEVGGAYVFLRGADAPALVVYGGTAATAIVIGGSALYVAGQRVFGSPSTDSNGESGLARVAEVVVSVTVLTAVTVLLGSLGGLGLSAVAALGGPDPKTADDEPLRTRLLDWAARNREFMRANGQGELPLNP